jgi:hypothetical protein
MTEHTRAAILPGTATGPFDSTAMSVEAKTRLNASYLRIEALVEDLFDALDSALTVAALIGRGFNLMRHTVRVSDVRGANTRFVA